MSDIACAAREEPWYGIDGPYTGTAPCFVPKSEVPAAAILEQNWRTIRDELDAHLRARAQRFRKNFDPYGFDIAGWKTINFMTYLRRYPENQREFPRTVALLEQIPDLTSAFLNLLEPRTRIPPHYGDSNCIWRCHLGLIVPAGAEQCGIEVGEERRGWCEGEVLVFSDAHRHSAWNDSDAPRVILIFDVMKPAYRAEKAKICARVLAAIALLWAEPRWRLISRLPRPALRGLHVVLGAGARLVLALQRGGRAGAIR